MVNKPGIEAAALTALIKQNQALGFPISRVKTGLSTGW
jgi:hypothetical protein